MVRIFSDRCSLARAAAGHIVTVGRRSIVERDRFDLVLSGGKTPKETYKTLAEQLLGDRTFWEKTHIYWGDERYVPSGDARSNYFVARNLLMDPLNIPPDNIHPIPVDVMEPMRAAELYEKRLPEFPDLLMLGVGEDGHTASLFPDSPALDETERGVVVTEAPAEPKLRISVTPPVIAAAREVMVLVTGGNKAEALGRAFASDGDFHETPARLARDAAWFVDAAAAEQIVERGTIDFLLDGVGSET